MIKIQAVQGTKLSQIPQHTYVEFPGQSQRPIFFNSKFDSGNLQKVIKNGYDHYSIYTAADAQGTSNQGYPKSWFYFQTGGFKRRKITFSIHRVHFLWAMSSHKQLYRPVYRITQNTQSKNPQQQKSFPKTKWQRLPYPIISLSVNNQQQLMLKFDFYFNENIKSVQFAFTYPYSHQECRRDIIQLNNLYYDDSDIFLKQYELCKSYGGRVIDLVIISSHQGKDGFENIKVDDCLTFGGSKLTKFRNNKPIIFISARVHPIQTPSSYTMTGIIKFLLDKEDYRAHLLRKYFVFVLVPMLNPDGVSNGHCRMDILNQNLNRYYKNPDPLKQTSCYSVLKLCEHYDKDKRLFMYLDLHAHPANKGNFMFGNAIFDYIDQVQSHVFPKILSQNCINFEFQQCIFSRKHMKAKDRNQDLNKQGCGRVVFYKQFGLTHSYTLQCGYHCNAYNNNLSPQQNINKNFIVRYRKNQKGQNIYDNFQQQITQQNQQIRNSYLIALNQKKDKKTNKNYQYTILKYKSDTMDNIQNNYYKNQIVLFNQDTFYNLGRNICITILDVWNKNPYTRIIDANQHRKQIAQRHAKLDRFKKQQAGIKTKQKKIIELIQTQCYSQWHKRNVFQFNVAEQLKKSFSQMKKTQRSKIINQQKPQLSLGASSKISAKGNLKLRQSLIKQQKKIQISQAPLQSLKTIATFDEGQLIISTKISQINMEKTNFRPLMNVRIRNIQLGNRQVK